MNLLTLADFLHMKTNCIHSENGGRVEFIRIVIHNHFILPMSLFIDLAFRLPKREASSEQFLAVLPLQLQKDK